MTRLAFLLLLALPLVPAQTPKFEPYNNSRFGYTVSYPPAILVPQGESTNGDGQKFLSKDKSFAMSAWGGYNALEQTVAAVCQAYIDLENKTHPFRPTYKVVKPGWYVYSGVAGTKILYQKGYLQGDVFTTLRLEYPLADKAKLDAIVNQIIASLEPAK